MKDLIGDIDTEIIMASDYGNRSQKEVDADIQKWKRAIKKQRNIFIKLK